MAMNKHQLNILLDEPLWEKALPQVQKTADIVFLQSLDYVKKQEEIDFLNTDKKICINLSLSNDTEVHKLNKEFRHMDKATNVLSFANIDDENFIANLPEAETIELGDIIIALETMEREAAEKQISLHDHFCHLLTHGILHLLGFDHQTDEEADYMEGFEIQILKNLNINNPYEE